MPYKKREHICKMCSNPYLTDEPKSLYCKPCRPIAAGLKRFKGGLTEEGYRIIRHNGKQRLEHRVIMEQLLGRTLVKPEHVHHKDDNNSNNSPDNLILCSRTDCAVLKRTYTRSSLEERFWPKVLKTDGCWLWQANKDKDGYGMLFTYKDGKETFIRASHVSWQIHYGPVPKGLFILHTCDNPPCVNPEHLFTGTVKDNAMDAMAKGRLARGETHGSRTKPERVPRGERHGSKTKPERVARGERCGNVKLTEKDVRYIREAVSNGPRGTKAILAEHFGVSRAKISQIALRQCWKHVP